MALAALVLVSLSLLELWSRNVKLPEIERKHNGSLFLLRRDDRVKSILRFQSKQLNIAFQLGTIHLRRRQIFTIFDPYPPTIGIPAKCL